MIDPTGLNAIDDIVSWISAIGRAAMNYVRGNDDSPATQAAIDTMIEDKVIELKGSDTKPVELIGEAESIFHRWTSKPIKGTIEDLKDMKDIVDRPDPVHIQIGAFENFDTAYDRMNASKAWGYKTGIQSDNDAGVHKVVVISDTNKSEADLAGIKDNKDINEGDAFVQ